MKACSQGFGQNFCASFFKIRLIQYFDVNDLRKCKEHLMSVLGAK